MILLVACCCFSQKPSLADLDRLAQARDVPGLSAYVSNLPAGEPNPLTVIKTNGAYEGGRFGWHAFEMASPVGGKSYVVLSTFLTNEDTGEFLFEREGDRLKLIPEDDALGVQIEKNVLDVAFDVPKKTAKITDHFTVRATGEGDFVFRMSPEFRLSTIADEAGQSIPFSQAGGVVVLQKPKQSPFTFVLSYEGIVDHPDYSGSISPDEATLTNDYWYPMVARQPVPYVVTVHSPKGWTTVGQGDRLSDSDTATEHVSHFKMDLPIVFYSLSSGPYKSAVINHNGRSFTAWSPRDTQETLATQAETYPSIVSFYERFSAFPFKGYGALDSPHYGGGAMEAYSYATYGGGFPTVDAHEPAHTWWGGVIENTYLHSFWNESFAVFCDGLYHRESPIGNATETRLAFVQDGQTQPAYELAPCSKSGVSTGDVGSSLGYGKGSQVLQMLEQIMGTESLTAAMHKWIEVQPHGKAAEWEDFEKVVEETRPDLHVETFFADWLDLPGHVEIAADAKFADGAVTVNLRFVGQAKRIPLDVMLTYADGSHVMKMFDVRSAQALRIPSSRRPVVVSLDPHRRLIRAIAPNETPLEISRVKGGLTTFVDPAHKDWAKGIGSAASAVPANYAGALLIGSPETWAAMKPLCAKAGFQVSGNKLTYQGTTIDLNHGAAEAVFDLGGGKYCGISLGKTRIRPDHGRARLGLFDDLGRMVRGKTEPKTSGDLTYRLP